MEEYPPAYNDIKAYFQALCVPSHATHLYSLCLYEPARPNLNEASGTWSVRSYVVVENSDCCETRAACRGVPADLLAWVASIAKWMWTSLTPSVKDRESNWIGSLGIFVQKGRPCAARAWVRISKTTNPQIQASCDFEFVHSLWFLDFHIKTSMNWSILCSHLTCFQPKYVFNMTLYTKTRNNVDTAISKPCKCCKICE